MKWIKGLLIIGLSFQFSACSLNSEDEGATVASMRNKRGNGSGVATEPSGATKWGVVSADQNVSAQQYNEILKYWVYTDQAEPLLGYVEPNPSAESTGVYFWGSVRAGNIGYSSSNASTYFQSLSQSMGQSRLNIQIWDEYAGKEYGEHGYLNPYEFDFGGAELKFAYSSQNLNKFTIIAQDKYGVVVFSAGLGFENPQTGQIVGNSYGGVTSSLITGEVWYYQKSSFQANAQLARVGTFKVETCGFFVCQ